MINIATMSREAIASAIPPTPPFRFAAADIAAMLMPMLFDSALFRRLRC